MDFLIPAFVALSVYFLYKKTKGKKCSKCSYIILIMAGTSFAQDTEKPFILEHEKHLHRVDFVNATVFQQIRNYSAIYNTFHAFFSINPSDTDHLFFNASYTVGNGITKKTERLGYSIATTGDDLEDYLRDINGTGREYLLEIFYQKDIGSLSVAGGIIDSTAFVDTNRYANDEHIQFLNSMFINNPVASLPSYNPGAYLHYQMSDRAGITGVYIKNSPDEGYTGILEVEYETEKLNVRPYYFYVFGGEEYKGTGLSMDYTVNSRYGLFFRGGMSDGDYRHFISGGAEIKKIIAQDRLGVAYGFIKGDKTDNISACECYYSVNINKHLSVTADLQYIKEKKEDVVAGGRIYLSY